MLFEITKNVIAEFAILNQEVQIFLNSQARRPILHADNVVWSHSRLTSVSSAQRMCSLSKVNRTFAHYFLISVQNYCPLWSSAGVGAVSLHLSGRWECTTSHYKDKEKLPQAETWWQQHASNRWTLRKTLLIRMIMKVHRYCHITIFLRRHYWLGQLWRFIDTVT